MNANVIIRNEMTLDEKLAAIDEALATAIAELNPMTEWTDEYNGIDPASLTMCEGCQ